MSNHIRTLLHKALQAYLPLGVLGWSILLASCSMTKDIPDGDQLYTGLKEIAYQDHQETDTTMSPLVVKENLAKTQEQIELALAAAPNGSIFGSSYYRVPFSFGVAVWNKYANRDNGFARWMTKTFGKQPVLMSWVNPLLRAQVAQNVLYNNGYFSGRVAYENLTQKNPKTAKIAYTVIPGHLYTLDSISFGPYDSVTMAMFSLGSITLTCPDSLTQTVTITNDYLQFPNLVTPNGDGTNDTWVIVNLVEFGEYPTNELWIYNQWGALVYHVRDIRSEDQMWDPNKTNSPAGAYYYRFTARGRFGITKRNGLIEVVR